MSHVSRMTSAHMWMSKVSFVNASSNVWRVNESCLTYERLMSDVWMCHVSHTNESGLMYKWVTSRRTHGWDTSLKTNESCHTHEWGMSHKWMSHVSHMNESRHGNEACLTNEWVMSHIWMSHVTGMRHVARDAFLARMSHVTRMANAHT